MLAPQVIVPPRPPLTLNVGLPATPVSDPAVAPHVPVTAVRLTPPAVAVTLANVPLTAPVVRTNAFVAETFTEAPIVRVPKVEPLMPVVELVTVTTVSVMGVVAIDRVVPDVPSVIITPLSVD